MHAAAASGIRRTLSALMGVLDNSESQSLRPFDDPGIMVPNVESKRFGWTHYGVMIPDLPEPHRFFSAMSLIGATGSLAFDNDHALADRPRRNASVVVGTAASYPDHFGNYSTDRDFISRPDGSLMKFGDDLTISGNYPEYHLSGRFGGVEADLQLTNTDKVTWFVRNPVYKHLSLLTEYRGRFSTASDTTEVEGLCTFEYGACPSPYQLRSAPLPPSLKAPLDLFVYQIVNLGPDEQVLLAHHHIGGRPFITTADYRGRNTHGRRLLQPRFEVLQYRRELQDTPYGIPMRLPAVTRFTAHDENGVALEVTAELDTTFTFGLGSGFVTGFRHESLWRGEKFTGRGYQEYIDRRR
ncbi:MAG: hypothetical protein KIH64_013650 [Mycobacterium sp.]|nr:hypothetical protein [Mycobacterium sp.]